LFCTLTARLLFRPFYFYTFKHILCFYFTRPCSGTFLPYFLLACTLTYLTPTPHTLPTSVSTFWSLHTAMLKMEAAQSSKMYIFNYHTTQQNNPENHEFNLYCGLRVLDVIKHLWHMILELKEALARFSSLSVFYNETYMAWNHIFILV
jgi:hypothetical protein